MSIKKIRISNFKSFKELIIELGKFNVLIGANASGKSNLVQIFKFLRDIVSHNLDDAISMQGGVKYFRNINIGSSKKFKLEVVFDQELKFRIKGQKKDQETRIKTYEFIYIFGLKFTENEYKITEDRIIIKCKFIRLKKKYKKIEEVEELGEGEIVIFIKGKRGIAFDLKKPDNVFIKIEKSLPMIAKFKNKALTLPPKITLLNIFTTPLFPPLFPLLLSLFLKDIIYEFDPRALIWGKYFKDIGIYNFDPKRPKKAVEFTGKTELEEDGSNLTQVLNNIIEDEDNKRKFCNLIKDLLPFVDDLDIDEFIDKSMLFKLRENYFRDQYLPAFLISDGTINIAALIIALYFEQKPFIIIEEPERNIHPYLIAKLINMMKDVSVKKQIIISTHNPEIVKYADLKDILLISRDEKGFSKILRPAEKKEAKEFFEKEMGIAELYVQNLLEL